MDHTLRQHLRQAIDTHRRARRQALINAGELEVCSGCGGELADYTPKCPRCYDRKRRCQKGVSLTAYGEDR